MAQSPSSHDITQWRVTTDNPPRNIDGIDVDRCIALHNEIYKIGWTGSGRSLDDLPTKTFLDFYSNDITDELRDRLSEDLKAFLGRARHFDLEGQKFEFFYYVSGLYIPGAFFENSEPFCEDEEDHSRFVTLYGANGTGIDMPDGVV